MRPQTVDTKPDPRPETTTGILDLPDELIFYIFGFLDTYCAIMSMVCVRFNVIASKRPLDLKTMMKSKALMLYATNHLGLEIKDNKAFVGTRLIHSNVGYHVLKHAPLGVFKHVVTDTSSNKQHLMNMALSRGNRGAAGYLITDLGVIPDLRAAFSAVAGKSLRCFKLVLNNAPYRSSWAPVPDLGDDHPFTISRQHAFQMLLLSAAQVNATRLVTFLCEKYTYTMEAPRNSNIIVPYTLTRNGLRDLLAIKPENSVLVEAFPAIHPADQELFFYEIASRKRTAVADELFYSRPHLTQKPTIMRSYRMGLH